MGLANPSLLLRRLGLHRCPTFLPILRLRQLCRRTRLWSTALFPDCCGLHSCRWCRSLFNHGPLRRSLWRNAVLRRCLPALNLALPAIFRHRDSGRTEARVLRDHRRTLLAGLEWLTRSYRIGVLPHARLCNIGVRLNRRDGGAGCTLTHDLRHCHRVEIDATTRWLSSKHRVRSNATSGH